MRVEAIKPGKHFLFNSRRFSAVLARPGTGGPTDAVTGSGEQGYQTNFTNAVDCHRRHLDTGVFDGRSGGGSTTIAFGTEVEPFEHS